MCALWTDVPVCVSCNHLSLLLYVFMSLCLYKSLCVCNCIESGKVWNTAWWLRRPVESTTLVHCAASEKMSRYTSSKKESSLPTSIMCLQKSNLLIEKYVLPKYSWTLRKVTWADIQGTWAQLKVISTISKRKRKRKKGSPDASTIVVRMLLNMLLAEPLLLIRLRLKFVGVKVE